MSFQPTIVGSGLIGWQFLQATKNQQVDAFNKSTLLNRDVEYFRDNIGSVKSAEELVNNRRLLSVALSAFGLEDQIDSKFLLKRVIEEGTGDDGLARKLSDGRYMALAGAFSFEPVLDAKTSDSNFVSSILEKYETNVLAKMERGLSDTGDSNTSYGNSVREQVKLSIAREGEAFKQGIGAVKSAEDLIKAPRFLLVALTAFGLEEKVGQKSLLKSVLEQGGKDPSALANILGDSRYEELASAFEFDRKPVSPMAAPGFADNILSDFRTHEFEVAVGNVDENLRFALNFERAIPQLAKNESSDNTKWYQVLGTTSLRKVFQSALGLPSGFSQIDLDKQLEVIKEKVDTRFGIKNFSDLTDPDIGARIIESFLLQSQVQSTLSTGAQQTALTMLQAIPRRSLF
ncbi:MAG: DUF1217 domain-containing protein [Pelagimonas sp.]|jgi:hypothetical protein|nr:DUF1217 domain-containing protein [Pelagimonas sp.]